MTQPPTKQILFVAHRLPYPADKGEKIRTWNMIKYLATAGHDVHLVSGYDEEFSAADLSVLQSVCASVRLVPIAAGRQLRMLAAMPLGRSLSEAGLNSTGICAEVKTTIEQINTRAAIVASSALPEVVDLLHAAGVPLVVDAMDIDSQKWADYSKTANPAMRWIYRREAKIIRKHEEAACEKARAVLVVSDREAKAFGSNTKLKVVPNGVSIPEQPVRLSASKTAIFVGVLNYKPNLEGVLWFANHVWPLVLQRHPGATWRIVGRDAPAEITSLDEREGICVVGRVPELWPEMNQASLALVPLLYARGLQNKVIEAMAAGLPTIVSAAAASGIHATPGEHLAVANTPSEWLDAIDACWSTEPQTKTSMGQAGRDYVLRHHDWSQCLSAIDQLL